VPEANLNTQPIAKGVPSLNDRREVNKNNSESSYFGIQGSSAVVETMAGQAVTD